MTIFKCQTAQHLALVRAPNPGFAKALLLNSNVAGAEVWISAAIEPIAKACPGETISTILFVTQVGSPL